MNATYPLHFTIPPLSLSAAAAAAAAAADGPSGDATAAAATGGATTTTTTADKGALSSSSSSSTRKTTVPVVVGHLTHAHEAALNCRHTNNDKNPDAYASRFTEHESERYASWRHPSRPKAAQAIPALAGDWACAPLYAPRPRDPMRGSTLPPQPPVGKYTRHWEERGVMFWHVPTVGSALTDAAKLIWEMEDYGALPLCNEATEATRAQIRFLGRYDINDYGIELATNQSLPPDDPYKVTIGHDEESTTHFDILLASTSSNSYPVSLGAVCHFCTIDAYWDHFMDLSARRDEMNFGDNNENNSDDDDDDDDDNAPDIDEVVFDNGLQILSPTTGGAISVLRSQDRMHLRAFLHHEDSNNDNDEDDDTSNLAHYPAVKAFIFYGASDEEFFSEWRVGGANVDTSCPIIPGPSGLPPGGILSRNDEVDNLYGCRPFDHAAVQPFFNAMLDDQALAQWWSSLPRPLLPHLVCRLIRGCYVSLWQRLERVSLLPPNKDRALHLFVDDHCREVALNVPELNPNYQRAVAFEQCPTFSVEDRNEMAARVANALLGPASAS